MLRENWKSLSSHSTLNARFSIERVVSESASSNKNARVCVGVDRARLASQNGSTLSCAGLPPPSLKVSSSKQSHSRWRAVRYVTNPLHVYIYIFWMSCIRVCCVLEMTTTPEEPRVTNRVVCITRRDDVRSFYIPQEISDPTQLPSRDPVFDL